MQKDDIIFAVKKLPALSRGITFRMKTKLDLHEKLKVNKKFCNILMLLKTLKYYSLIQTKNLIKCHLLFMQILNRN